MREKILVPAVLLAGVSLVIGAAMMAARGEAQPEGSEETLMASAPEAAPVAASDPSAVAAVPTPAEAMPTAEEPAVTETADTETTTPESTAAETPASTPVTELQAPENAEVPPPVPEPGPGDQPPTEEPAPGNEAPAPETTLPPAEELVIPATNGTAEPVSIAVEAPEPVLTNAATTAADNKITVNLDDVELQQVVKLFTRLADANIMFTSTNLRGTVSVHLKDVEWRPALEAILSQHGLTVSDTGSGVYSIVPKEEGRPEPLMAQTIFLKYAKVVDVKQAIKDSLDPRGKVADFVSRNALVVRTTRLNMNEITNIVGMIDVPRGQVYIEAKFMELSDVAIKNLGVNWQMLQGYEIGGSANVLDQQETITKSSSIDGSLSKSDERDGSDAIKGTYNVERDGLFSTESPTRTIQNTITRSSDAQKDMEDSSTRTFSDIRTAILSPLSFNLILSALKQETGVSVVSNPRILVANSEPATIHIGERRTPLIPRTSSIEGSLRTTYEPGTVVESGVKLTVTPTINTESNITVEIQPEITRILSEGEWTTAPDGSKYPATANKVITTIFSLLSGETAAIGGLTETSDQDVGSKIPVLGDIPLIGKYLFSHQRKEKTQKETIIFVTVGLVAPDRLEEDVGMPAGAELVHKRAIIDAEERRQFEEKLNALQDEAKKREERSTRKRQFLLNRTR